MLPLKRPGLMLDALVPVKRRGVGRRIVRFPGAPRNGRLHTEHKQLIVITIKVMMVIMVMMLMIMIMIIDVIIATNFF
jgi:hypothetical protein